MMLTVTTAVVALLASTIVAASLPEASSPAIPPMIVTVVTAGELSSRLVAAVLAEADAIWRPNGVSFVWRRVPPLQTASQSIERAPYLSNTLRLIIGDERGTGRDGRLPLGWILFDGVTAPQREIYISHANAQAMLESASS